VLLEGWVGRFADPPFVVFATLLLGTGAMRLGELAVSVRRMRARPDAVVAEPWLFPAMAALHTGLVVAPLAEVVLLDRPFVPWLGASALIALVLATALRVWTLRTIGRSWNVRVVVPSVIASEGPYRYIRHPNYLVVIAEIAALPLVHDAWISAIALSVLNGLVLSQRIPTEEKALMAIPEWRAVMADKARFIPGIF
jgi:methyltransferase